MYGLPLLLKKVSTTNINKIYKDRHLVLLIVSILILFFGYAAYSDSHKNVVSQKEVWQQLRIFTAQHNYRLTFETNKDGDRRNHFYVYLDNQNEDNVVPVIQDGQNITIRRLAPFQAGRISSLKAYLEEKNYIVTIVRG